MILVPKDYAHCPKKHAARQATIVEIYQKCFGPRLPQDKQYWTMSALCSDGDRIRPGSELDQITEAGLIRTEQFYGVDIDRHIYENNAKYVGPHWYHGDFLGQMVKKYNQNPSGFNPAIVNADLINMPARAASYIANILDFLCGAEKTDTMVVANVVLKSYSRFSNVDDLRTMLVSHPVFNVVWSKDIWRIFGEEVYEYKGTDSLRMRSGSIMGTVVFVPSKRMQ